MTELGFQRHAARLRQRGFKILAGALVLGALLGLSRPAEAKYASFLMDAETGQVLHSVDADEQNYPASLTKMMTLYLLFEALDNRKVNLNMRVPISEHAADMAPSKLNLRPGDSMRLEDALLGLVTKSANDAAVVIAEALGGSEENFAKMMTNKARRLGMSRTNFENASGLPDPEQVSTARDMAQLGRALIRDYPAYYPYFNTRSFTYNGRVIGNHNHLLGSYDGADGIKTGFIRASGFNLVASAKRDGRRLIGVVFGGQSQQWRDQHMARLLDKGFGVGNGREEELMVARADTPRAVRNTAQNTRPRVITVAMNNQSPQGDAEDAKARAQLNRDEQRPSPFLKTAPHPAAKSIVVGTKLKTTASALAVAKPNGKPAGGWVIQVGAFSREAAATAAATTAIKHAKLSHASVQVSPSSDGTAKLYRARLTGLAEEQARAACRLLSQKHGFCVVVGPNAQTALR